mmetsp:Transcript_62104/g.196383  ORF Transcript_62104/g.196383 Transcript_62104/m.196383 type:complete len:166 (-) Transcript_62104:1579-2076(-)|eukprot:CAMPEP_0182853434 /NCGR_PEP_ID=MMETSP0034_2-20130328/699_1 /TAXON_ID=156128 /ORGANISM="Nephroselmis pyriformis, Strain CCMP717" /LENGTH=165 /DNA_ID=CAMNT_0024984205 /DNA_START=197 /DNA_END=694 /DNA_ORIENTATION=+
MLGGGGVDGAIHRAAGPALKEACYKVPEVSDGVRCPTGSSRITGGFNLPAKHVIHTVGPVYRSAEDSAPLLRAAYTSSLALARDSGLETIAFPAVSCGVYGYPLGEAAKVSVDAIQEHAKEGSSTLTEVHFVLFGDDVFAAYEEYARLSLERLDPAGGHGSEGEL